MKTTKKNHYKFLAIIAFLGLFLASCSSDDDANTDGPEIISFEYGEGSSHSDDPVAYKGDDIHIEAEIFAEATVAKIEIHIHSHDVTPGTGEVEWDEVFEFTDDKYLVKNPELHEHIEVPTDIPAGEYHIEIVVIDQNGNEVEEDGHLEVLDPVI